ncbi:MAG: hypothetical protein RR761_12830, partial [Aeromonas sp.]|uniref:hypothetical protein n=1 Tax=Aeromonas sp. TaxID=647 RepID=UPI002FCBE8C2
GTQLEEARSSERAFLLAEIQDFADKPSIKYSLVSRLSRTARIIQSNSLPTPPITYRLPLFRSVLPDYRGCPYTGWLCPGLVITISRNRHGQSGHQRYLKRAQLIR